jgi:hypothetical protein
MTLSHHAALIFIRVKGVYTVYKWMGGGGKVIFDPSKINVRSFLTSLLNRLADTHSSSFNTFIWGHYFVCTHGCCHRMLDEVTLAMENFKALGENHFLHNNLLI